ncbi:MAG: hypothetical protein E6689_04025 [Corynebacterium striatum]|uniref:hypothetical protein n=1 Tax=Corynebacterium simulans TaxID=146827 RepID=UPI00200484A5|nr:hypothetical protein [Corynebacterium striatum]
MTDNRRKPLPQEIYMRRRVAALIGLLVLVGLLIWAATSMFGGSDESVPTAATSARGSEAAPETSKTSAAPTSDAASSSASAAPSGVESSADSSAANQSESSPYPAPSAGVEPAKNTCALEDLEIVGTVSQPSYSEGEYPTFFMEVKNPTAADCVIDLDKDILRFEVYDLSTNEKKWADTDCFPPVDTGEVTFEPGKQRTFQADWSRKMSQPNQCNDRAPAPVGGYFMHAVIGNHASKAETFNLDS